MASSRELEKRPQSIQSVVVGSALLSVLAEASEALPLGILAERAGMVPAKAHRYLAGYICAKLISQEPVSGRYDLGPLALDIGLAALRRLDLLTLAQPIMTRLRNELGQTVSLTIWGNRGPTIVRWVDSLAPVTISVSVGSVLPLLTSSNGKIFLTYLPRPYTNTYVDNELRDPQGMARKIGVKTARDVDKIRQEVSQKGLAQGDGTVLPGICSVSAPVFRFDGSIAGSLTVLGVQGVLDISTNGPAAVLLRQAAKLLSEQMGTKRSRHKAGDMDH